MNTQSVSTYFSALELFGIFPKDLIGEVSAVPLTPKDMMLGSKDTVGIKVDDLEVELFKVFYDTERDDYYFLWHDLALGVRRNNNFAMRAYNDLYNTSGLHNRSSSREFWIPLSEVNNYLAKLHENLVTVFLRYDVPVLPNNFKKALVFMSSMIVRNRMTSYPALTYLPEQICAYIKAGFSFHIMMVLYEKKIPLNSPEYFTLINVFKNSPDAWVEEFLA